MAIVEKACVGKTSCAVKADRNVFGDPCYDVVKVRQERDKGREIQREIQRETVRQRERE